MVEKVCSLSPGLMRSGEYPRVKKGSDPKESFSMVFADLFSARYLSPEIFSSKGAQSSSVHPG